MHLGIITNINRTRNNRFLVPFNVKLEVQNNMTDVDIANKSLGLNSPSFIVVQVHMVKLFDTITQLFLAKWLSIKGIPSCPMSMNGWLTILNLNCQKYTVLGQSLFVGYYSSLTNYH